MYNLRYHVASLAAVFFALAVGLLLGTVVVERGVLDSQRSSLVDGLQSEFKSIREENGQLRTDLERERSFAQAAVEPLVADKLKGETVVLLVNAGRTDGLSDAVSTLEAAGARTAIVALAEEGAGLRDTATSQSIEAVIGDVADYDELVSRTTTGLAAEWSAPGARPITQALLAGGKLTIDDFPADVTADAVVLLAAWDGKPDPVGVKLASALRAAGTRVVGAQSQRSETGVAAAAAESGISSVDNIGTPEGDVSLVWVLSGAAEGRFGVDDGVDRLFPKLR